jgi:hypothetical protein
MWSHHHPILFLLLYKDVISLLIQAGLLIATFALIRVGWKQAKAADAQAVAAIQQVKAADVQARSAQAQVEVARQQVEAAEVQAKGQSGSGSSGSGRGAGDTCEVTTSGNGESWVSEHSPHFQVSDSRTWLSQQPGDYQERRIRGRFRCELEIRAAAERHLRGVDPGTDGTIPLLRLTD